MNSQEIIDILKSNMQTDDYAWGDVPVNLGLGVVENVDNNDYDENGGPRYYIKHFVDHNVYIQIEGRYTSHYGTDIYGWEYAKEVKPVYKNCLFYE